MLAIGAGVGFAQSAFAQPAGCTNNPTLASADGNGLMHASSTAHCSSSLGRTLRVEIKHDEAITPDPLVAANTSVSNGPSYGISVSSCDNGNTATYYGRGFFTSNSTYYDSSHQKWHVC